MIILLLLLPVQTLHFRGIFQESLGCRLRYPALLIYLLHSLLILEVPLLLLLLKSSLGICGVCTDPVIRVHLLQSP